jgi:hypothetical protein
MDHVGPWLLALSRPAACDPATSMPVDLTSACQPSRWPSCPAVRGDAGGSDQRARGQPWQCQGTRLRATSWRHLQALVSHARSFGRCSRTGGAASDRERACYVRVMPAGRNGLLLRAAGHDTTCRLSRRGSMDPVTRQGPRGRRDRGRRSDAERMRRRRPSNRTPAPHPRSQRHEEPAPGVCPGPVGFVVCRVRRQQATRSGSSLATFQATYRAPSTPQGWWAAT